MVDRYFDCRFFKEYPGLKDLNVEEMIRDGVVFSRYFLAEYLRDRIRQCGAVIYKEGLESERLPDEEYLGSEEVQRRREDLRGMVLMAANWMSELGLDEGYCPEENIVSSPKIRPYSGIGRTLKRHKSVLLSGKLEGTTAHFGIIRRRLSLHAAVVAAIEPKTYFEWISGLDPLARGTPFFEREIVVSLWAHHPLVAKVTIVPEARHSSPEAADLFYTGFFDKTKVDFACATFGEPAFESKLERGVDLGRGENDWRMIPRSDDFSSSQYLKLPDLFSRAGINFTS